MSAAVGASLVALPAVAQASSALPAVAQASSALPPGFSFLKLPEPSWNLIVGPDGNIWSTGPAVQRITPQERITVYPSSGLSGPVAVRQGKIWSPTGSLTMGGVVTTYPAFLPYPLSQYITSLAAGPHGGLWFTSVYEGVGLLDAHRQPHWVVPGAEAWDVILGPDGAMWFTQWGSPAIGRIAPDGSVSEYTNQGLIDPNDLTVGADGDLWFIDGTEWDPQSIGRITMDGHITYIASPDLPSNVRAITFGPCNLLWLSLRGAGIGSMSMTGVVRTYWSSPSRLTTGGLIAMPDGTLWFEGASSLGRFDPKQAGLTCP